MNFLHEKCTGSPISIWMIFQKWVWHPNESSHTYKNFLCFLSIIMANFSENLVTIPLSMALLDQGYWSPYIGMAWFLLFVKKNQKVIWGHAWCQKKYFIDFQRYLHEFFCMNFLLELKFFILSHPLTSKQPHKIVQIHMGSVGPLQHMQKC